MGEQVITVRDLHKSYGEFEAVRGIDLAVERGEVFAFLGPNGAGKTTTVEILEGFRHATSGDVSVFGADPAHPPAGWRSKLGIVLQSCNLSRALTVRESLELYAGYYPHPRPVGETVELVGLSDAVEQRAGRLSGGQQRRLDVALALVGDPELLFLDEPTTGFDPAARRGAWDMIANLRQLGKTVFLTTHYMDEAQRLADRVAIIQAGRIVAEGPPHELAAAAERAATTVRFGLPAGLSQRDLPAGLAQRVREADGRWELETAEAVRDLADLCSWALAKGVELTELEAVRPSLEDVYLALTGEPDR